MPNKKGYTVPIGRIAQVSAIQDYGRLKTPKIGDFHSKNCERNPRHKTFSRNEGNDEYPFIHNHCPKLLQGKEWINYKQDDIFEIPGGNKKKPPPKFNKPILHYVDKITGKFN